MNQKDKQIFTKSYAKLIYKERVDIEKLFLIKFNNLRQYDHFQNKNDQEKQLFFFKVFSTQLIYEIECLGIYEYLSGKPVNGLFDAIYSSSRLNYLKTIIGRQGDLNTGTGGYDCMQVKYFIHAFAANDVVLGEHILKTQTKISQQGYRFYIVLNNILFSIYSNLPSRNDYIKEIGESFLAKKNSQYQNNIISFLVNLLSGNQQKANLELMSALILYKKQTSLHDFVNDLNKFVAIPILGIYSFLRKYLEKETFQLINIPEMEILSPDILHFQFSGKDFITFDRELSFIQNVIEEIGN